MGYAKVWGACIFPPPPRSLQRHNGDVTSTASVKHLSHRRFVAAFQLEHVQRADQDLYRCITHSSRGSGVSSFAELIVKGDQRPVCLSVCRPVCLSCRSISVSLFLRLSVSVLDRAIHSAIYQAGNLFICSVCSVSRARSLFLLPSLSFSV